jgi:hypothetical protein
MRGLGKFATITCSTLRTIDKSQGIDDVNLEFDMQLLRL